MRLMWYFIHLKKITVTIMVIVKFPSDLAKYGAIYGISFFCFLLLFMKVKQTVMCERFVKTETKFLCEPEHP